MGIKITLKNSLSNERVFTWDDVKTAEIGSSFIEQGQNKGGLFVTVYDGVIIVFPEYGGITVADDMHFERGEHLFFEHPINGFYVNLFKDADE